MSSEKGSNTIQAIWFGLGKVTSLSFTLVLAAVLARYLEMSEYGTYKQILYVYGTLQVVFTVGLPRAYGYFLATANEAEGRDVVRKLTVPLLGLGGLFSLFLYFGSPWIATALNNAELERGFKLFAPIPFLMLPTLGLEGIYSAVRKSHVVAVYQVVTRCCMVLAVVLPVVYIRNDYEVAIHGWTVASLVSFLFALVLKYRPFPNANRGSSTLSYRDIFQYTVPLMTASLYGIAFQAAGKFYISRYFGEVIFAEFSNGFMDLPFVGMVAGATAAVLLPVFARQVGATEKRHEILETWLSAWKKSAIIVYPLLVFFLFHAENVMVLLYGSQYAGSSVYFQISLVANFFAIITFVPVILALGETRFYGTVHLIIAVVIWGGGFLIIKFNGSPVAIAAMVVILNIGKSLWFMQFIAKKLSYSLVQLVPYGHLARLLAHSVLTVLAARIMVSATGDAGLTMIVAALGVYGLLLIATSRFFGLDYLSVFMPMLRRRVKVA